LVLTADTAIILHHCKVRLLDKTGRIVVCLLDMDARVTGGSYGTVQREPHKFPTTVHVAQSTDVRFRLATLEAVIAKTSGARITGLLPHGPSPRAANRPGIGRLRAGHEWPARNSRRPDGVPHTTQLFELWCRCVPVAEIAFRTVRRKDGHYRLQQRSERSWRRHLRLTTMCPPTLARQAPPAVDECDTWVCTRRPRSLYLHQRDSLPPAGVARRHPPNLEVFC